MSFKENIQKVLADKNMTQQSLLIDILTKLNTNGKYNVLEKYEKEKSNFSNMIKNGMSGDRKYKLEYIIPTEEILDIRFADLLKDDANISIKYVEKGFRYVAAINDYDRFIDLVNETVRDDRPIIYETDEYNKTILDYIIEYKATNGIKVLVDKNLLKIENGNTKNFLSFYRTNDQIRLMKFICEMDDAYIFNNVLSKNDLFSCYIRVDLLLINEKLYESILETQNILKSLLCLKNDAKCCNHYSLDMKKECHYFNPILVGVVEYAMKHPDIYDKQLITIFKEAESINGIIINDFINDDTTYIVKDGFILNTLYGDIRFGDILYYDKPFLPGTSDELQCLIHKANSVANKLIYKVINSNSLDFTRGKYIINNDVLYKQNSNNKTEYLFYHMMNEKNIQCIPKFLGTTKDNVDQLQYIVNSQNVKGLSRFDVACAIARTIRKTHKVVADSLNGNVYVHGNLTPDNIYIDSKGSLAMIYGWECCKIGNELDDFCGIVYNWCYLDEFSADNSAVLDCISEIVSSYELAGRGLLLGTKLIEYIDEQCKNLSKEADDYSYRFRINCIKKSFIELYEDKINEM